jgi:AcrR family transcriptional regulator
VTGAVTGARANQRLRTRKDLLEAAARLTREGGTPSFEEIAEAALISRATAYRYFPGLDALLLEAALHVETPTPEGLFGDDPSTDALVRIERLDAALSGMVAANETPLRAMLAQTVQRKGDPDAPVRQNRRSPLIAAALQTSIPPFRPAELDTLSKALAVLMGIEAVVAFKDVLNLPDDEAARVRRWMIRALVEAARNG